MTNYATTPSTPAQPFTHELNPLKGFQSLYAISKTFNLTNTIDPSTVKAGMVVYLTNNSTLAVLGTATPTATKAPISYFLFNNGQDFDTLGDWGNVIGAQAAGQTPTLLGFSSLAGYELQTTEFTAGSYATGDLLTGGSDGKVVIPSATGAAIICGIVTDGLTENEYLGASKFLTFQACHFVRSTSTLWS